MKSKTKTKTKMAKKSTKKTKGKEPQGIVDTVEIELLDFRTIWLEYEGISPLICNSPEGKFDPKPPGASGKRIYDEDEEFIKSLYFLNGVQSADVFARIPKKRRKNSRIIVPPCGVPARWFRQAAIYTTPLMGWGRKYSEKRVKGVLFTLGDVVPLIYNAKKAPLKYWARVVRPPSGKSRSSVMVTRSIFPEWGVRFQVRYDAENITPEHIFNLFQRAGTACGYGDDRPARNGTHGMAQLKGMPSGL